MRGAARALGLSTLGLAVAMFERASMLYRAVMRRLKLATLTALATAWVPHNSRIARSTGARSRSATVSASDAQQWIDFTTHQAKGEWHCARTTYDASGALVGGDESLAIVSLQRDGDSCDHAMRVPTTEVASSGCDRCASTMEFRDIALGSLLRDATLQQCRRLLRGAPRGDGARGTRHWRHLGHSPRCRRVQARQDENLYQNSF